MCTRDVVGVFCRHVHSISSMIRSLQVQAYGGLQLEVTASLIPLMYLTTMFHLNPNVQSPFHDAMSNWQRGPTFQISNVDLVFMLDN